MQQLLTSVPSSSMTRYTSSHSSISNFSLAENTRNKTLLANKTSELWKVSKKVGWVKKWHFEGNDLKSLKTQHFRNYPFWPCGFGFPMENSVIFFFLKTSFLVSTENCLRCMLFLMGNDQSSARKEFHRGNVANKFQNQKSKNYEAV